MSRDFSAKKVDLDLVLVTLSEEKVELSPKNLMSADEALRVMKAWQKDESTDTEDESELDVANKLGKSLAEVYPKDAEWWSANFDMKTLSSIVVFVAETIGGVEKKEESSS